MTDTEDGRLTGHLMAPCSLKAVLTKLGLHSQHCHQALKFSYWHSKLEGKTAWICLWHKNNRSSIKHMTATRSQWQQFEEFVPLKDPVRCLAAGGLAGLRWCRHKAGTCNPKQPGYFILLIHINTCEIYRRSMDSLADNISFLASFVSLLVERKNVLNFPIGFQTLLTASVLWGYGSQRLCPVTC